MMQVARREGTDRFEHYLWMFNKKEYLEVVHEAIVAENYPYCGQLLANRNLRDLFEENSSEEEQFALKKLITIFETMS